MAERPLVFIHGYSASGASFDTWKRILQEHGYAEADLHVLTYKSLTNEVTIDDVAEGFDRALRVQTGLNKDEEFDAIVHSTGMLVVRAWLSKFGSRRERLRHLVGLVPATFGSPLAHKGRGWLGAIFAGNREAGPDFMEAGDRVLDGLELGSRFTWDLAHRDLIGGKTFYGETRTTPYVFTFCGTERYGGLARLVSEPGTDGTVRLAGCPLNTRKIILDLTLPPGEAPEARADAAEWSNADIPLIPIAGLDHGTILKKPSEELIRLLVEALQVNSRNTYLAWHKRATAHAERVLAAETNLASWQQIVFRVVDERGEPVPDYFIDFIIRSPGGSWVPLRKAHKDFEMDVHVYGRDKSLRCFHINLDSADISGQRLGLQLIASSGTELVAYHGYVEKGLEVSEEETGLWDGVIDLTTLKSTRMNKRVKFFYPFTTTLVEIRLNREPMPLSGLNELAFFPDTQARKVLLAAQEIAVELRKRERDEERLKQLMEELGEKASH